MPKRDRIDNETIEEEVHQQQLPLKRGREEDEEEGDDEEEIDEEEEEASDCEDNISAAEQLNFVAWLEDKATALSVGELHFSSTEFTGGEDNADPNSYCVVMELKLLPPKEDTEDEESPLIFSYDGAFPFKVLPMSSCVGIPLEPVILDADDSRKESQADDDGEHDEETTICKEFSLRAEIHQALLEDLLQNISQKTYARVANLQAWKNEPLPLDSRVVDGVNAWWKAGEAKTGWDLSKIPKEDYTNIEMLHQKESNSSGNNYNVLLDLYRHLCAYQPLTASDDRDVIEDRFEWRTCLCTYLAWAVPNEAALRAIYDLQQPILEIGAGTGYWAWLLEGMGVNIVAYDASDSHNGHKHRFRHSMVRDGGVEQAAATASSKEHESRALMLCWPDIVGDSASDDADRGTFGVDTLNAYCNEGEGTMVIYIGELGPDVVRAQKGWGDPFPPGGSSASAAFQTSLSKHFDLQKRIQLPNWPPYNSHLTIWKRKAATKA